MYRVRKMTSNCVSFFWDTLYKFSTINEDWEIYKVIVSIAAGLALIISGGYPIDSAGISVEVFVPTTGQHCQLPSLPGGSRSDHSINDKTICGGGVYGVNSASRRSCLTLNSNGNWLETTSLLEQR